MVDVTTNCASIFHILAHAALFPRFGLEAPSYASVLEEHESGAADHANRLWLLLSSEVWYRMYIEGVSVEELEGELGAAA